MVLMMNLKGEAYSPRRKGEGLTASYKGGATKLCSGGEAGGEADLTTGPEARQGSLPGRNRWSCYFILGLGKTYNLAKNSDFGL